MTQRMTASVLALLLAGTLTSCASARTNVAAQPQTDEIAGQPQTDEIAAGKAMDSKMPVTELQITDTQPGSGEEATEGKRVTVHYTGTLYPSGKKFDSSHDHGQPFSFRLGEGQVIEGWDKGFAGMKVGGKRTLLIPPQMGYGASGAGGVIPPNATLKFDVELVDVE